MFTPLLRFHRRPVIDAMGPITDKLYDEGGLEIHIYGEVPDDIKAEVAERGVEVVYHPRVLGYGSFKPRQLGNESLSL